MNPDLYLVETLDEAKQFTEWLKKDRMVLAIDTETTGLEWWTPGFLRTCQFGDEQEAWCLPVTWWYQLVKEAVESYDRQIVMHNAPFDVHALASANITTPRRHLHDTKAMAWLLNPLLPNGLKKLARQHVDPKASAGEQALHSGMRVNGWTWATVPLEFPPYWQYAALDTALTAALFRKLYPAIQKDFAEAYDFECAVQMVLTDMETRGIRIDLDYTQDLSDEWTVELADLAVDLAEYNIVNPNSRAQVIAALKAKEDWEPDAFTPTGQAKTDDATLKGIDSAIVPTILRHRRITKWKGSYLDNFLARADGDVLHANINSLRAKTGRMSITEPALQTLPRGPEIRRCFIPFEGEQLWAIDYAGIEARLIAHFSNSQKLIDAFLNGIDPHSFTAKMIFNVENPTSEQRQKAKNVTYAKFYGAQDERVAATAGEGTSVEEAAEFLERHSAMFPEVKVYADNAMAGFWQQMNQGLWPSIRVEPYGHRLMAAPSKKQYGKAAPHTLLNYAVQGPAAVVFKSAILRLDAAGLSKYAVLPVHDELIFSIPIGEEHLVKEIQEVMEDRDTFRVPLLCDVTGPLTSWGAKYEEHVDAVSET